MKHLSRVIFFALATGAAGAACAQAYAGAGIGRSNARLDCTGTLTCDKTDTAFKIFGGYLFLPYLGVEAVYYNQGKAQLSASDETLGMVEGKFKGDGLALYGLALLPLNDAFLFVKAGVASAKVKLDATSSVFGGAGTSERHSGAAWGLGAGYNLDKSWTARVEYERVRVKFMDEKINVGLVTLGAHYRF